MFPAITLEGQRLLSEYTLQQKIIGSIFLTESLLGQIRGEVIRYVFYYLSMLGGGQTLGRNHNFLIIVTC